MTAAFAAGAPPTGGSTHVGTSPGSWILCSLDASAMGGTAGFLTDIPIWVSAIADAVIRPELAKGPRPFS
jgi:hypothetical protein